MTKAPKTPNTEFLKEIMMKAVKIQPRVLIGSSYITGDNKMTIAGNASLSYFDPVIWEQFKSLFDGDDGEITLVWKVDEDVKDEPDDPDFDYGYIDFEDIEECADVVIDDWFDEVRALIDEFSKTLENDLNSMASKMTLTEITDQVNKMASEYSEKISKIMSDNEDEFVDKVISELIDTAQENRPEWLDYEENEDDDF